MSRRPIEAKQRRRVAKQLRKGTLPRYFDLVDWLVTRGHAPTRREARRLILAKRVKANSHVLGYATHEGIKGPYVEPYVPAEVKDAVIVQEAA